MLEYLEAHCIMGALNCTETDHIASVLLAASLYANDIATQHPMCSCMLMT